MKLKLVSAMSLFFIVAATATCAAQNVNPFNSNGISKKPYDDLKRNSYGSFSKGEILSCNPANQQINQGGIIWQMTHGLQTIIEKPIEGQLVTDPNLIKLGLQDQFASSNIGDIFNATVVVLGYDKKGITFWYNFQSIYKMEIENAARKYCSRNKMKVIWNGSARGCSPTVATANGQSVHLTYVIADFSCKP